jgi:secreted Zn-dependent insulinase-like peptidase
VITPVSVVKRPLSAVKKQSAQKPIQTRSLAVDHNDKAVALYVQGVNDTMAAKAKMVLLRQVLESSFYSQLRTEQQLGYIVFLTGMPFKEVPGSAFVVQSPSASLATIQQSMQTFITESIHAIPDDLSSYQRSAATKLLEKSQSLADESSVYWQNILKDDNTFTYRQRLVDAVHQVTAKQLRTYYQQTLLDPQALLWFVAERDATDTQPVFDASSYYQYP